MFLTLNSPFKGISISTVASILQEVIKLAGLEGQGLHVQSFRPTGARKGVDMGILPETVMQLGRWKTKETFLNHYVYPKAPHEYTTNLIQQS